MNLVAVVYAFLPFKVVESHRILHKLKAHFLDIEPKKKSKNNIHSSSPQSSGPPFNFAVKLTTLKVKTFRYFRYFCHSSANELMSLEVVNYNSRPRRVQYCKYECIRSITTCLLQTLAAQCDAGSVANYSNRPRNYTAWSVNRLVHERTDAAWSGPGIRKAGMDETYRRRCDCGDSRCLPGH